MDFILNEATEEQEDSFKLVFSDDSEEEYSEKEEQLDSYVENNEDEMFLCDASSDEDGEQCSSFYRSVNNKEERVKFPNQTRNLKEVVEEFEDDYFREDDMPELFDLENRDEVKFDSLNNSLDKSRAFKNSLVCFTDVDNHFFLMLLFMVLCTVKSTNKRFYLKKLKKL